MLYYIVKFHHPLDPGSDTYLSDPGDSEAWKYLRSDAYHFKSGVEALAEAERLNRECKRGHIILPVLKKRNAQ